jgi:hypothetical protein
LDLVDSNAALNEVEKSALKKLKKASVEKLKTLNSRFDKFYSDLTKVDDKLGINPITSYLQAENLKRSLGCNMENDTCSNGYMLQLRVIKAGGNVRLKKNLITNIFTGADITHSGGSIVEFKLYDLNGKVLASNTFTV